MSRERQIPICYQITVTNIITIGIKVMSDFFISFQTQNKATRWNSPLVHNMIGKDSKDYPWTIKVDSPQIIINFHFIQQGKGPDQIIGSAPLLLMKKQGDQQFLIFGCNEQNKGRKVAEVMFEYTQCSTAQSIGSQLINQKNNQQSINSSDSNKRVSLEYTIQMQNYNQVQENMQYGKKKIGLGSIPQQSENTVFRQQLLKNQKHGETNGNNIEEMKHRSRVSSIDNSDFNFLKDIEDTTDRWYRINFGKQKPLSNEPYEFGNHQNSGVQLIHYERQSEYLNDITFSNPHIQLKNIIVNSNRKAKTLQFYAMGKDPQDDRQLIASVESSKGYKKQWTSVIRLPKEKNAYGIDIITIDKQKLQGLIIRDPNYSKNTVELFDRLGKNVGNVTFILKEVKKIEIQTMELMEELPNSGEEPILQEFSQHKSSLLQKSNVLEEQNNRYSNKLSNNALSQFKFASIQNSISTNERKKLLNNVYLNRKLYLQEELVTEADAHNLNDNLIQRKSTQHQQQRQMSNKLYINSKKQPQKKNLKKNKYQSFKISNSKEEVGHQPKVLPVSQLTNNMKSKYQLKPHNIVKQSKVQEQQMLKQSDIYQQISNYNNSLNSSNQFLTNIKDEKGKTQSSAKLGLQKNSQIQLQLKAKHVQTKQQKQDQIQQINALQSLCEKPHRLQNKNEHKAISNKVSSIKSNSHLEMSQKQAQNYSLKSQKQQSPSLKQEEQTQQIEQNYLNTNQKPSLLLKNKIHQIKRMSHDLSKIAKVIPSARKTFKYKTIVYNEQKDLNEYENKIGRNSPSNQSSEQQIQMPKKTYRQPINATVFLQAQASINEIPNININEKNQQKESASIKNKTPVKEKNMQENNKFNDLQKMVLAKQNDYDAQQQIPIKRYNNHSSFIKKQQKSLTIPTEQEKPLLSQSIAQRILNQQSTKRFVQRQRQKEKSQLGINTERMGIVNNIMQSSYIPIQLTNKQKLQKHQKEQRPQIIKQSPEKNDWAKSSLKEQLGSFFDSIMHQKQQQPKAKYFTQTIQPTTQKLKLINFLITTISINYYDTVFGGKYVKIYIPNKFIYQTDIRAKLLAWNCTGFTFSHITQSQNIHIELRNDSQNVQQILGTTIIGCAQFKNKKNQTVIRAFLTNQNRIIGEAVLSYQSLKKNMRQIKDLPEKRHTASQDNKTLEHIQKYQQKNSSSHKKNGKDPVVQFLKINKKEKISRYMVNQYQRANIESRINPIRTKKYTAGKNIVIGKDIRFPFSLEEEHFQAVPGPGKYETRSQFKRYRGHQQTLQK